MNQIKINLEKRKVLNLLRYSSLSGNKCGTFNSYSNENDIHMDMKYSAWKMLKKNGYSVYCEAIFKTGGRPDILAIKDGIPIIVEILSSETEEQLAEKVLKYPEGIEIIKVKDYENIVLSNFE